MHKNLISDKLHKIFVSTNDTALQTRSSCLHRQRADNVISFISCHFQSGYIHGFNQFPYIGELFSKFIRHLFSSSFVFRIHLMTKCFLFAIEDGCKVIWRFISQQFKQRVNEPKKSAGVSSIGSD